MTFSIVHRKTMVNTLYVPLINQDGSNYGHIRVSFPNTNIDIEKLAKSLPYSNLKDQLAKSDLSRLCYEQDEPEDWGYDTDVWSQERSDKVDSLKEALDYYYCDDD